MRTGLVIAAALAACKSAQPPEAVAPDAGAPPAAAANAGAVLEQTQGAVERQRAGRGWTAASRGDRIGEQDGLRTPIGAIAVVSVDGVRVTLHDRSELRVTAAQPGRLAARVRGRVESDVKSGRVSLQVDDAGAKAESEGGP